MGIAQDALDMTDEEFLRLRQEEDEKPPEPMSVAERALNFEPPVKETQYAFEPEEPNFAVSMGRGMMDVGQGLKQLYLSATDPEAAKQYQQEVQKEIGYYNRGRGEDAGMDWGRLAGEVVGTAPTMAIPGAAAPSLLGRMASGAAAGGMAGGSLFTGEDESRLSNALVGATGGAAVPAAVTGIAKAGGKVFPKFQQMMRTLRSPEISVNIQNSGVDLRGVSEDAFNRLEDAAREQMRVSGQLDPETLQRIADAEKLGFSGDLAPTQGQATRVPEAWGTERNLSNLDEIGTGLKNRFRGQNKHFVDKVNEMKPRIEGAADAYEAGSSVFDAVDNTWDATQKAVGAIYKDIDENSAGVTADLGYFWNRMQDKWMEDATLDDITETVRRKLLKRGVIDSGGELTGKRLPIKTAESLRKSLGEVSDKNQPALKRAKREMIDAMDDSVIESAGDDTYKAARDAARERFQMFETKITNDIVKGKTAPDVVYRKIVGGNVRDIVGMRELLNRTVEGQLAWQGVRKQVLQDLIKAGTKGKEVGDDWSGARYQSAMEKFGPQRLKEIFSPEEYEQLGLIDKVGQDMTYEPFGATVNYSKTAPVAANLLRKSGMVSGLTEALSKASDNSRMTARVGEALTRQGVDPNVRSGAIEAAERGFIEGFPTRQLQPGAGLLLTEDDEEDYLRIR